MIRGASKFEARPVTAEYPATVDITTRCPHDLVDFLARCANKDSLRTSTYPSTRLSFLRDIVKLDADFTSWTEFEPLLNLQFFSYQKFCVVADRFEKINVTEVENTAVWPTAAVPVEVLHSADGPSVTYRDGFKLYHWRGTLVPSVWIERKDDVDPALALTWHNIEQRRALVDLLGWERVLTNLPFTVVDEDPNPQIGTLIEVDVLRVNQRGLRLQRFLRVRCATERDFVLPVPSTVQTALEANAWTYGITPEEFKPEIRT